MSNNQSATFPAAGEAFITSWSGGKDACFAYWLAKQQGAKPAALFTMLDEHGAHTSSHGLYRDIIEAQASLMGIPALFRSVARGEYEQHLRDVIQESRQMLNASSLVFGDIDLEAHKVWYERICSEENVFPRFPLWNYSRQALLDDMLAAGFKTMIVSVQHEKMDRRFLGKTMTPALAEEIQSLGICRQARTVSFTAWFWRLPVSPALWPSRQAASSRTSGATAFLKSSWLEWMMNVVTCQEEMNCRTTSKRFIPVSCSAVTAVTGLGGQKSPFGW